MCLGLANSLKKNDGWRGHGCYANHSVFSSEPIRFDYEIFCSLHADHLHVALAFRREGTDLEISEYKMIEAPESVQKVRGRNGIFGVVGLGTVRYAQNPIRADVPNPQGRRAIGEECPAVEPKALTDEMSVVLALASDFVQLRFLLCKYSDAV